MIKKQIIINCNNIFKPKNNDEMCLPEKLDA